MADPVLIGTVVALFEGIASAIMGGGSSRDWSGEIRALERQLEMSNEHHKEMHKQWENERKLADAARKRELELVRESMEKDVKAQRTELEYLHKLMAEEKEEKERRRKERLEYPIPEWLNKYVTDVENLDGEKRFVNVGIVGNSGVGNSKFINSIRGYKKKADAPSEEHWADVGVKETTILPSPFAAKTNYDSDVTISSAGNQTIMLWDLPGVGTPRFPTEDYFKTVGLRHFDIVLIMAAGRFSDNDFMLKNELERVKLPFFFIRSKIDIDVTNNMDDHEIEEAETLRQIKDDLKHQGVMMPFLVSAKDVNNYDLPLLIKALRNEALDVPTGK
mmetsp:Transcript_32296/g.59395  ORF Transcript_32296/g.59395 Transcript_32296/m.59395 type:complete len:333 (-) Transcript_32296:321-1319(-)|eukprot:CAMPEP_0197444474 /NCGR_PEP_ID=MMETSP1175-20131217/9961_1 /TAXON_ID=1003142 /ORGANISM="Triceratium dubium, Strain CCMP147" /LENGTH=332 /DNA_ID=CAMNT_0042975279 /DNA_START=240 /DNA_END=1238 /DNA_ORIENTATION=-